MPTLDPNKKRKPGDPLATILPNGASQRPPDYDALAVASSKRAQAINGIAAPPATPTPTLYRAGAAVGASNQAAHNVAGAVTGATDSYVNQTADNANLGARNFMAGLQGQSPLTQLPATVPTPTAAPVAAAAPPHPQGIFQPTIEQLRVAGAIPASPRGTPTAVGGGSATPGGQIPVPATVNAAPPKPVGIDSGVTLSDGRKLPYGAMVNGVPTFSDGTGAPPGSAASIPQTMSRGAIDALGARMNTVPAAAFTQAGGNAFNSDNTAQNVAGILRSQQGGKFGITPEMAANAERDSIMSGDWRTAAGTVASNLARTASGASTVLQRKAALAGLADFQGGAIRAANQVPVTQAGIQQQQIATQGRSGDVATQAAGQLGIAGLQNQGRQNVAGIENQGKLAATGLAGQYSVAQAEATAGARKDTLAPKDLIASAQKAVPGILGMDPLTGMIHDASAPGGARLPTSQEQQGALKLAMQNIRAALHPGATAPQQAAAKAARPTPGEVRGGMRFKGGDPNVQGNWEKAA